MAIEVCPAGVTDAGIETVWGLVANLPGYPAWADVKDVVSCEPAGPAVAGQHAVMRTVAAGLRFPVTFDVLEVAADVHTIELDIGLPFGLRNAERIVCQSIAPGRTVVRFY